MTVGPEVYLLLGVIVGALGVCVGTSRGRSTERITGQDLLDEAIRRANERYVSRP